MRILNKIKSESIISIDIETVRLENNYEDLNDHTKLSWQYKHKNEGVVPTEEELAQKWLQSASLYAEFSKICAVSIAFLHKEKLYVKEFYGNDEIEILGNLSSVLENINSKSDTVNPYRLLGHASKYFDYPFLCKRYVINSMEIPGILDTSNFKPWEQINLCTNELWKMGGTGSGGSLLAVCNALQIPISKIDLVGDEVGKSYFNSEYEKIGRYCSYDAVATFNIFRKLKKEHIFEFIDAEYIQVEKISEEEKAPIDPLADLYNSDYLSDKIKGELQEILSKKKKLKKDLGFIQNVLENVYIRSEFMDTDKPDVVEAKKAEIAEFIKTLK